MKELLVLFDLKNLLILDAYENWLKNISDMKMCNTFWLRFHLQTLTSHEKNNVSIKFGLSRNFCTNPSISLSLSLSLCHSFSADAGFWLRYFSPCWEAEIEGEKDKKRRRGSRQCLGTWGILERQTEDSGNHRSDNALRRSAQGKLNQVVFVLICIPKASCAGSGLVWGDSLGSTMGTPSDKVSGDGLGLSRGPAGLGLGVADVRFGLLRRPVWKFIGLDQLGLNWNGFWFFLVQHSGNGEKIV